MTIEMTFLTVFLVALAANLTLTPLIMRLAHRNKWYDQEDDRKIHNGHVPRLGGIGLALSTLIAVAAGALLSPAAALGSGTPAFFVVGALLVFHLLGLVDDFRNVAARRKLAVQGMGAVLVAVGLAVRLAGFEIAWLGVGVISLLSLLALIWAVSVVNAVNLIDGMDGLAGGVAAVAALAAVAAGGLTGSPAVTLFAMAVAGAAVGFLVFNRPRASIFMGDCGSLFLGGAIAVTPLLAADPGAMALTFFVLLSVLAVPGVDTTFSIIRRVKQGVAIHAPDRGHVHHQLIDAGWSVGAILSVIYALTGLAGAATLSAGLQSPVFGLLAALGSWLIVAVLFVLVRVLHRRAVAAHGAGSGAVDRAGGITPQEHPHGGSHAAQRAK